MTEQQMVLFDYDALDIETRLYIEMRTLEIKGLMKRAALVIIEIGKKLIEVKSKLDHGQFGDWLKIEFEWSLDTAQRFIRVAKQFGEKPQIAVFAPSALYLLSSPSTPEPAKEEALNRAEAGETITYSKAKETVDRHKEQAQETEIKVQHFDDWISDPNPPYEVEEELPPSAGREFVPAPAPVDAPAVTQGQSMTLLTSSLNDSWRTPSKYIEAARIVLGGIDLDPASSAIANETVKAAQYFNKAENGLEQIWRGTVWINPPYGKTNQLSNQGLFAHKLVQEYMSGHVTAGIILVNLYAGYGWFAPLREFHRCELDHRISFINPATDEEGDEAKASSVFIYLGPDPEVFYKEFSQFGVCGQLKYYR